MQSYKFSGNKKSKIISHAPATFCWTSAHILSHGFQAVILCRVAICLGDIWRRPTKSSCHSIMCAFFIATHELQIDTDLWIVCPMQVCNFRWREGRLGKRCYGGWASWVKGTTQDLPKELQWQQWYKGSSPYRWHISSAPHVL